jgi:hypothetical protein
MQTESQDRASLDPEAMRLALMKHVAFKLAADLARILLAASSTNE